MGLATLLHGLIPTLLKTLSPIHVSQKCILANISVTHRRARAASKIALMTSSVSAGEEHRINRNIPTGHWDRRNNTRWSSLFYFLLLFCTNTLKLKAKYEAAGSVFKCGSRLILANEAFIATFKCTGGSYLCF